MTQMTTEQVRSLHTGDEVYWNDPDGGLCSRPIKILEVHLWPQMQSDGDDQALRLMDMSGDVLECFASELT